MDAVIIRTIFALAAVLLVMWFCARLLRRSTTGRTTDVIELLGRQQLTKSAAVAVVRVADRAYVLGVTDGRVELVAETALDVVRPPVPAAARERRIPHVVALPSAAPVSSTLPSAAHVSSTLPSAAHVSSARDIVPEPRSGGVLAGSALSPSTWRAGVQELRERSVRRA